MILYSIWVLPIIRELWDAHSRITHPWYADDTGAKGNSGKIFAHFRDLQVRGPQWGYFSEPTKSILVIDMWNVAGAEDCFGEWA